MRTRREDLLARCWLPPWEAGNVSNADAILIALPIPGRRHPDSNGKRRLCKAPHTSITALETSSAKSSSVPVKLAAAQLEVKRQQHLPASARNPEYALPQTHTEPHRDPGIRLRCTARHICQAFRESTRAGRSSLPCAHPPASCHSCKIAPHRPRGYKPPGHLTRPTLSRASCLMS